MKKEGNNLAKYLRLKGFVMPITAEEILAFEEKYEKSFDKPKDFDLPLDILKRGKIKKVLLNQEDMPTQISNSLSVAAREGNSISVEIRKKMNEDRKNEENNK